MTTPQLLPPNTQMTIHRPTYRQSTLLLIVLSGTLYGEKEDMNGERLGAPVPPQLLNTHLEGKSITHQQVLTEYA